MALLDYIPHGLVASLATVATYVFTKHEKLDELRFKYVGEAIKGLGEKLDKAREQSAANHAHLLEILLHVKGPSDERKL